MIAFILRELLLSSQILIGQGGDATACSVIACPINDSLFEFAVVLVPTRVLDSALSQPTAETLTNSDREVTSNQIHAHLTGEYFRPEI